MSRSLRPLQVGSGRDERGRLVMTEERPYWDAGLDGAAEIVIFQGSDSGPTGLAGGLGVSSADFELGRKVGCFLMDAAQGPSPP